eukprot:Nk52_evm2s2284 gene=Nk52_evmTU2s2284
MRYCGGLDEADVKRSSLDPEPHGNNGFALNWRDLLKELKVKDKFSRDSAKKIWAYISNEFKKVFDVIRKGLGPSKSKWILPVFAGTMYESEVTHAVTFFLGEDIDGREFLAYFDINYGFTVFHLEHGSKSIEHMFEFYQKLFSSYFRGKQKDHFNGGDTMAFYELGLNAEADTGAIVEYVKRIEDFIMKTKLAQDKKPTFQRMYESFGWKIEPRNFIVETLLLIRPFEGLFDKSFSEQNIGKSFHEKKNAYPLDYNIGSILVGHGDYWAYSNPFNNYAYGNIISLETKKTFSNEAINFYFHLVAFGLSDKFITTYPGMTTLFERYAKARQNIIADYELRFKVLYEFCTLYQSSLDELFAEDFKNFPFWKELQEYRKTNSLSQITLSGYFNKGSCVKILDSEKKVREGIDSSVFGLLVMPFVVNFFDQHKKFDVQGKPVDKSGLYKRDYYAKTSPHDYDNSRDLLLYILTSNSFTLILESVAVQLKGMDTTQAELNTNIQ